MPHKDTEPFEQLLGEEEVEAARYVREQGKRGKKKRDRRSYQESLYHRPEGPPRDYAPELPKSHGASLVNRFIELVVSTISIRDPGHLVTVLAVIFLMANALASRGWLSIPGLSQFASAESVMEIRVEQLDEQIENTVREHCQASTGKAKSYYYRKIRELQTKYQRASGGDAEVPTCRDLGVNELVVSEP